MRLARKNATAYVDRLHLISKATKVLVSMDQIRSSRAAPKKLMDLSSNILMATLCSPERPFYTLLYKDVVFVGNGKGSINKEHVVEKAGYQWKPACGVALCLILVCSWLHYAYYALLIS